MRKLLTSTIIALTALGTQASALDIENPIESGLSEVTLFDTVVPTPISEPIPVLNSNSVIAVARIDGGRLIPTPHEETVDWTYLDRRLGTQLTELGASNYYKYIPEIPFQGEYDTDNKIDEIRLTAANEGMDYVLIYGVGPDASWASFGKKALSETGLTVHKDCKSWEQAKAKALLVDSFTGEVMGAVTAENIEFNIGELADRVGEMILDLSGETPSEV